MSTDASMDRQNYETADETTDVKKENGDQSERQEPKLATVKMFFQPSGQIVPVAFSLLSPIEELLYHFAKELRMNADILEISHKGVPLKPNLNLSEIDVEPNTTVNLELRSKDPNEPLRQYKPRQDYSMPDVITVRLEEGPSISRDVVVEIERNHIRKPYLGGMRHRLSGKEFHHASAQTLPPQRPDKGIIRVCRDTQTIKSKHRPVQTLNDMSTQMTKPGVYISEDNDRCLTPKRYQTADEKLTILTEKVLVNTKKLSKQYKMSLAYFKAIIIQKYYRRWLAKRDVNTLREGPVFLQYFLYVKYVQFCIFLAFHTRVQYELDQKQKQHDERQDRFQNDLQRRLHPRTKDDFDVVYSALEKWREEEIAKINATKQGAARKAALAITPYSIRARELMQIYNTITMKFLTLDERLDILLTLKHTVKEHECRLTQEIIQLIDREADLLMRGVKEENLSGLRKRISTLFLQYIKTPTFNPGVVRHLKVPQDPIVVEQKTHYCRSCQQYYPSTEFTVSTTNVKIGKCRHCLRLENIANKRSDHTKYKFLLKKVEKEEYTYNDGAQCVFHLTVSDIEYLYKSIWDGHSALSEEGDVYNLTFVRWNKRTEFTPWNCILLTLNEAIAHLKIDDLDGSYSEPFCKKIRYKHAIARAHFSKLVEYMKNNRPASDVGITGIKVLNTDRLVANANA
ncbi:unnamed protein product [Didymodactylos carnosus]|uniref:IQ motif and ubiquitin-like domain-containing protein n=3 Tax=Didymodactylos carnosus TaxID=1234261 RepID=A0A8S2DSZ4_9BILA|nr:unnamed protein product [Didymodactylos carnosus]CAF3761547.1 unnamed protein product [Didymodactylos carnosus]